MAFPEQSQKNKVVKRPAKPRQAVILILFLFSRVKHARIIHEPTRCDLPRVHRQMPTGQLPAPQISGALLETGHERQNFNKSSVHVVAVILLVVTLLLPQRASLKRASLKRASLKRASKAADLNHAAGLFLILP